MMDEQDYLESLEEMKNEVMLPRIREIAKFPFRGSATNYGSEDIFTSAEEVAEYIVALMRSREDKKKWIALTYINVLVASGVSFSSKGAVVALLDASGCEGTGILDEVEKFFTFDEFVGYYDDYDDLIEVIRESADIYGEIDAICRLLKYDAESIRSSMDDYRAGVPLEDIMA